MMFAFGMRERRGDTAKQTKAERRGTQGYHCVLHVLTGQILLNWKTMAEVPHLDVVCILCQLEWE